jgi:hypothetical protein
MRLQQQKLSRLFAELRRRKLSRAAGAYLVPGWIFFQVTGLRGSERTEHSAEDAGHYVPRNAVVGDTQNWLDKYPGPLNP